ncbi:MAG: glycosyl transferase [Cyanobacteria bacterium P01_C01_bin.73]
MSPRSLYVATTNHGFGHTTRAVSVAATVRQLCPDIPVILATTAPPWLLSAYCSGAVHRAVALDVGVVQTDSFTMDKAATLQTLRQIQRQASDLIQQERDFLRQQRVGLVLADIPPLATAIADAASVPCWMMSNFGWDFIYRPWGGEFVAIADWIAAQFERCDRLFRLPFHEPMTAFPTITDVGLTGGTPRYDTHHLRSHLGIATPPERTALLTFGGLGLHKIPYSAVLTFPKWQFITFDQSAPRQLPNLTVYTDRAYRPVDLMPLCGRVVSKPGYSTFAEACRLGVPVVTLPRQDFAEAELLLSGIQNYAQHQILDPAQFFAGDWSFLDESPNPPRQSASLNPDGNSAIAREIVNLLKH